MSTKPSPTNNSQRIWNHTQLSVLLLLIGAGVTLLIGVTLLLAIITGLPSVSSLDHYQPPQTTLIFDDRGQVAARVFRENRVVVPLGELPKQLTQAFIAAEDARFFDHHGVDGLSIVRALLHNLQAGERRQGGSTITQQVARALLLDRQRTYVRKIREAILAYRIDQRLSKEDILHIYLNHIYLGSGAHGVEAAAQTYFGKSARDLNLAEISLIAGLPPAPSLFNPFRDQTAAKRRQSYVLNRMVEEGFITPATANRAYRQPLRWATRQRMNPVNGYFVQQVKNQVKQGYGSKMLYEGGLRVHTSLNQQLQRSAATAIKQGIKNWEQRQLSERQRNDSKVERPQAALIAIAADSGLVLAVSGGADFATTQFNRATQARRQPGSAFKTLVYAAALEKGMTPATVINDEPISLPGAGSRQRWEPRNFSNRFYGPTTLRDGLVFSRNIATINIMREIGITPVTYLAQDLGITSPMNKNLSLALGSSEISLMELTAAYAAFANSGIYHKPVFIKRIEDYRGKVLERVEITGKRAIDARTAYQVTRIMEGVIKDGTGSGVAAINIPAAGKTGTTNRNVDAWFIGYTPELVTGVWVGFDQKRSLGANETGGRSAAPIWLNFMQQAKKQLKNGEFARPEGIVMIPIDHAIGDFDGESPGRISWEAFRVDNLPAGMLAPTPIIEEATLDESLPGTPEASY